jgi:hypothetical protein
MKTYNAFKFIRVLPLAVESCNLDCESLVLVLSKLFKNMGMNLQFG